MVRNKKPAGNQDFLLVNVVYEGGSQLSNRRVLRSELTGLNDAAEIRRAIEAQDEKIGALSGRPRPPIKSISVVRAR